MHMKRVLQSLTVFALVFACFDARAAEPLALFDNFNKGLLNSSKWIGYEREGPAALEAVRQIENGRLHLFVRAYGVNGSISNGGTRLSLLSIKPINAIRATIMVKRTAAKDCQGSGDTTRARARIAGYFFNTGSATPGSSLNDVFAWVGLERDGNSKDPGRKTLRVNGGVYHCANQDCSTTSELGFKDMGTAKAGQKVQLLLEWDQPNHRFIFQQNRRPRTFITYSVSDTKPPSYGMKRLDVQYYATNCTAGSPPLSMVDAYFDDVYINKSALSSTQILEEEDVFEADLNP
jgi:hypothetical protein